MIFTLSDGPLVDLHRMAALLEQAGVVGEVAYRFAIGGSDQVVAKDLRRLDRPEGGRGRAWRTTVRSGPTTLMVSVTGTAAMAAPVWPGGRAARVRRGPG